MSERDVLLDVSRLIWRLWRGRLPTGVDRVCLAYLDHYRSRSRAVVQRKGRYFILNESNSDRLFELLAAGPTSFRVALIRLALTAAWTARRNPRSKPVVYLNVGHTGLNDPGLGKWIDEAGVRAVFLVHDLIPILHPEYCRAGEDEKHERRMLNVLRNATGVIANSDATARDIRIFAKNRALPVPPLLTAWIAHPGPSPKVAPMPSGRPYFVTVGTIEARKNHLLLLQVWRRLVKDLGREAPKLLIVGQRGWEAEPAFAILDSGELKEHVVELGECGDGELASLISGANALLMPSFAEGFGLPVVEALEAGTPVIANDLPVFREFAGGIPTYLDPLDDGGWECAVRDFMRDSAERRRQLSAMSGFRGPDWPAHFHAVDAWIKTLPQ